MLAERLKVGVVPAGALGSAFANLAAELGHDVTLYFHERESLEVFKATGMSPRLGGIELHKRINGTCDIREAVEDANVIFIATPSRVFRGTFIEIARYRSKSSYVLSGSKGIEEGTSLTMSQIALQVLEDDPNFHNYLAVMSGPNLARGMAARNETATVIASYNAETATHLQELFNNPPHFRVYTQEDVIGVEAGGALKNIMAFGAGIGDVIGISPNTKAFYITRALAEMTRLGMALGAGDERTFAGLSGMGDLYLCCTDEGSRNKKAGEAFARGSSVDDLLASKTLVECLYTVRAAVSLAREKGIKAPISEAIHGGLYEGLSISKGMQQLLDRQPTKEHHGIRSLRFMAGRLFMRLFRKARGTLLSVYPF